MNETSAPVYLCDVLAFVVFKCRGYFHLLCCLMNSLRDCDLSFKQQKGKNSFSSWKQIKWAEARKAPFVLIFQISKQISIHANMYLNLLQIKSMHSIYVSKMYFDIICIIFFSGIGKCCCFYLDNVCYLFYVTCYLLKLKLLWSLT